MSNSKYFLRRYERKFNLFRIRKNLFYGISLEAQCVALKLIKERENELFIYLTRLRFDSDINFEIRFFGNLITLLITVVMTIYMYIKDTFQIAYDTSYIHWVS